MAIIIYFLLTDSVIVILSYNIMTTKNELIYLVKHYILNYTKYVD